MNTNNQSLQSNSNTNKNLTLIERLKVKKQESKVALLLDTSGSMSCEVAPGLSRIDALRNIVTNIKSNPKIYAFNWDIQEITKDNIPEPAGGTRMATAFDYIKQNNHTSVVLITDGEANDPDNALIAAKNLHIQILYVGPDPKPDFLDKLANISGGFATVEDLNKTKELETRIQLLLEAGRSQPGDNKGTICL